MKIITVCSHLEYTGALTNSATKNGWGLVKIKCEWKGFGTKIIETYNYLKEHPEITEFVFCDAFDVVCLGTPDEFKSKLWITDQMVVSCEKNLWPPSLQPFRHEYADFGHGFNYLNSGLYYAKAEVFIELFEYYKPFYEIDDQLWMNICFMLQGHDTQQKIRPDYGQSVFNSHSFISDGEYTYENNRVQIMGNEPCFIHFNGKTIDEKFNQFIKL